MVTLDIAKGAPFHSFAQLGILEKNQCCSRVGQFESWLASPLPAIATDTEHIGDPCFALLNVF